MKKFSLANSKYGVALKSIKSGGSNGFEPFHELPESPAQITKLALEILGLIMGALFVVIAALVYIKMY